MDGDAGGTATELIDYYLWRQSLLLMSFTFFVFEGGYYIRKVSLHWRWFILDCFWIIPFLVCYCMRAILDEIWFRHYFRSIWDSMITLFLLLYNLTLFLIPTSEFISTSLGPFHSRWRYTAHSTALNEPICLDVDSPSITECGYTLMPIIIN